MPEARFPAMGSTAHVVVVGDHGLLSTARARLEDLEGRWSRFREDSEVSRLNADGAVSASWETIELIERSILGWRATDGRFDPTIHDAIVAFGYDRDLALVGDPRPAATAPAPGCDGITIDRTAAAIHMPPGTRFDPGGIGKGLAADLVAEELLHNGAEGALVNLGGDLRAQGISPAGSGWSVALEGPPGGASPGIVSFGEGAVASSTPLKRRWGTGDTHHLFDPALGRPRERPHAYVAAVAAEAWWAEVATKDLLGKAPGGEPIAGIAGLVIDHDGGTHLVGGMAAYL
jgi:thiamine biosynthesis lipoprotein